jgi:hypothetical protein
MLSTTKIIKDVASRYTLPLYYNTNFRNRKKNLLRIAKIYYKV